MDGAVTLSDDRPVRVLGRCCGRVLPSGQQEVVDRPFAAE